MNCCHGNQDNNNNNNNNYNNNNNNQHGHGKGHKGPISHMLMMALCCGAPILILLLVPLLVKAGGAGIARFLSVIGPFLCPLMMVFMIPMMFRGGKGKENNNVPPAGQITLEEKNVE